MRIHGARIGRSLGTNLRGSGAPLLRRRPLASGSSIGAFLWRERPFLQALSLLEQHSLLHVYLLPFASLSEQLEDPLPMDRRKLLLLQALPPLGQQLILEHLDVHILLPQLDQVLLQVQLLLFDDLIRSLLACVQLIVQLVDYLLV